MQKFRTNFVQMCQHLLKWDTGLAMLTLLWAHGAVGVLVPREDEETNVLATLAALNFTILTGFQMVLVDRNIVRI